MGFFDSVLKKNSKKLFSSTFVNNLSVSSNKLLYNQVVLYFIFIVVLLNLFYLAVDKDYITISIALLVGFITSFFSKNMIVILFMALTISNMLRVGIINKLNEGYENSNDESNDGSNDTPVGLSDYISPDTCQGNQDCRSTEYCCNDSCVTKCTKNSNCGDTEYCNNGVCVSNP